MCQVCHAVQPDRRRGPFQSMANGEQRLDRFRSATGKQQFRKFLEGLLRFIDEDGDVFLGNVLVIDQPCQRVIRGRRLRATLGFLDGIRVDAQRSFGRQAVNIDGFPIP